jgi:hypothetical protein
VQREIAERRQELLAKEETLRNLESRLAMQERENNIMGGQGHGGSRSASANGSSVMSGGGMGGDRERGY